MNLLLTGAFGWTAEEREALELLGHRVAFQQQEKEPLPCDASWVEGVVCNGLFLSHPIESFPNLKYIQLTSAGFDRVNLDYVQQRGIRIHNARGVYSVPMAEFALTGVLEHYRQMGHFRQAQQQHRWSKHRGVLELAGKTVSIVGCGSVGSECAKRFQAFGCRVLGVDVMPYDSPWYERMLPLQELDAVLAQSDVAVLTLPLTEQTRGLMDAERLQTMKPGAVLVNIARGAVIDQEALVERLQQGSLRAVLDVFEEEPLGAESPLWELENVIITPHNSFVGDGNHQRMLDVILGNLRNTEI